MSSNVDITKGPFPVYDAADLGRAIHRLRAQRGWTQTDLAEWLGVHRVTVAKMEQGGTVDLPVVIRALAVLGAMVTVHRRGMELEPVERSVG